MFSFFNIFTDMKTFQRANFTYDIWPVETQHAGFHRQQKAVIKDYPPPESLILPTFLYWYINIKTARGSSLPVGTITSTTRRWLLLQNHFLFPWFCKTTLVTAVTTVSLHWLMMINTAMTASVERQREMVMMHRVPGWNLGITSDVSQQGTEIMGIICSKGSCVNSTSRG